MGIKFLCPNGHKMNVKAFLAGKRGKCPKCGASVRIPQETPASDSGEDLLAEPGQPEAVQASRSGTAVATSPAVTAVAISQSAPTARPVLPIGAPAIPTGPAVLPGPQPVAASHSGPVDPISQAPNSIWYVRPPSGGQYGPARGDIMRKWVSEGRVSGDSLVWREGLPEWQTAGQLFPSLAGIGTPAAAAAAPPPAAAEKVAEVPKVTRAVRKLNAYEARKSQGNGMAIAILIILGVICVALVVGLAVVLSQGHNGSKEAPKKSAAVARH
jgi:hypothetical protein